MPGFPFTAIVGADDMALALILTTISPDVGGVLVRGEKGTAKSTMVRALADVLPPQMVVAGCRFGCSPPAPDSTCPDGPHSRDGATALRPARIVELPVGATEDRVIGSLDLGKALGGGQIAFEPGLLAAAHRGILYVDEVNLLHDHLVDLLLDAAAMGRNTVEREGISVSHAARIVLVGTMNPEEGELRPQLLDRFGLTVEIAASRDPRERAEVIRRRLDYDADAEGFTSRYDDAQGDLRLRIATARDRLVQTELSEWALLKIATVCAGFEVDGMRADIVTARAARAHAAWSGRTEVTRDDIRVAARLALPHRRRRNPFDSPGLDEALLDQLLGDDQPPPDDDGARPHDDGAPAPLDDGAAQQGAVDHREDASSPTPPAPPGSSEEPPAGVPEPLPAPAGVAGAGEPYGIPEWSLRGVGRGSSGKRSRAITDSGRTIRSSTDRSARLHLHATISAAAPKQRDRAGGGAGRLVLDAADVRTAVTEGRESNLILIAVDASGSMGARRRMDEVKTAVLSLLTDAYQRRDRVGLITFRADHAELALPPTSSVEAAVACLATLAHGGRTPLAEGLITAARCLAAEHIRDPSRRALLVLVTDGRATAGVDALARARATADRWSSTKVEALVVDCETGPFRMRLAADLAHRMGARYVALDDMAASALVDIVRTARPNPQRRSVA